MNENGFNGIQKRKYKDWVITHFHVYGKYFLPASVAIEEWSFILGKFCKLIANIFIVIVIDQILFSLFPWIDL